MNRRIQNDHARWLGRATQPVQKDARMWVGETLIGGLLVLLAVLAFVALLGVDDFETVEPRQGTTEVIQ